MPVSVNYVEDTSNYDELLHYAQTIAQAFAKALDQNECSVKILIGLSEEIATEKDKVKDLFELSKDPSSSLDNRIIQDGDTNNLIEDKPANATLKDIDYLSIKEIIPKLRNECLDCDFNFPSLDFSSNFDWSFDKLKASLDVYKNFFKKLLNPNFCHVVGAFEYACIPSIISLILLLVSAYAAILALQKLGGISLSAFIQGIISGLLGLILASISIRLDTSNTGVACLIEAINEIANQIVSQQDAISGIIPTQVLEDLGYKTPKPVTDPGVTSLPSDLNAEIGKEFDDLEGDSIERILNNQANENAPDSIEKLIKSKNEANVESKGWTQDEYLELYNNLSLGEKSIVDRFMDKVQAENNAINKGISNSFKDVATVVEEVVKNLNESLSNMFGLLDYFQCENERSGNDFTSITEWASKITTVINLLSAIVAILAKKKVKKLCKTKNSIKTLVTEIELEKDVENKLTDLEQVELIEEFLEKITEITKNENGDIAPIIYDKDSTPILPKLSLTSCNLQDFIKAHTLENIVKSVLEDIEKDEKEEEERKDQENINRTVDRPKGVRPPFDYEISKNNWKVYPIKFERPVYSQTKVEDLTSNIISKDINSNLGFSSGIQSILDLVYNNPLDNKTDDTPNKTIENTTTNNNDNSIKNKDYLSSIVAPLSVDKSQKQAFENKCKDITDVLNTLGNLTKK